MKNDKEIISLIGSSQDITLKKIEKIIDPSNGDIINFGWRKTGLMDVIRSKSQTNSTQLNSKHLTVVESLSNHGLEQLIIADIKQRLETSLTFHFGAEYGFNRNMIIHQDENSKEYFLVSDKIVSSVVSHNLYSIRINLSDLELYRCGFNVMLRSRRLPFVMTENPTRKKTISHNWCLKFENRTEVQYFITHFALLIQTY